MVRDLAPADLKAIRAAIGAELRRLHSDLLREEIPDNLTGCMAKRPEPSKPSIWNVFKIAAKAVIEAPDEATAM
jgi:hypothetical protein